MLPHPSLQVGRKTEIGRTFEYGEIEVIKTQTSILTADVSIIESDAWTIFKEEAAECLPPNTRFLLVRAAGPYGGRSTRIGWLRHPDMDAEASWPAIDGPEIDRTRGCEIIARCITPSP